MEELYNESILYLLLYMGIIMLRREGERISMWSVDTSKVNDYNVRKTH